jgi:hypothetical protein
MILDFMSVVCDKDTGLPEPKAVTSVTTSHNFYPIGVLPHFFLPLKALKERIGVDTAGPASRYMQ